LTHPLLEKHRATLDGALSAIRARGYWTPYPEQPSPKVYGESANEDGKAAALGHAGKNFEIDQPGVQRWLATERSPYGVDLDVRYPQCDPQALVDAGLGAMEQWQAVGVDGRTGICLEALARINKASFEIGHAVMLTTGQGWMMAFQAGGPHAQDRGLEAVAYAYREMSAIPAEARWEKPQGKNPPIVMEKRFEVVGRGVALVIGCGTFPTWNTYPGLFAALVTGNPVILKPHPNAVLPAAISVRILRDVLKENGLDPNLVTLAVFDDPKATQALATHPDVKSIDFTGSTAFGRWLMDNARQAAVYAELAGVNNVVIESTDGYKAMLKNLAFTLSLYSGQMCTTTQDIFVPAAGVDTDEGHKTFDQFASDLGAAIDRLLSDPAVAAAVLGAIQSPDTLKRIDDATQLAEVVLASRTIEHPEFPAARVRSPVLMKVDATNEAVYAQERFGPISFVVRTPDWQAAVALSERMVKQHGALTVGLYSVNQDVVDAMTDATLRAGVSLSINLTGNVYVNQSAAFSDFHATGANPAATASYSDSAFVANRFRVVQRRWHAAS
jgi:phenylacetic acid degradation protein paaN